MKFIMLFIFTAKLFASDTLIEEGRRTVKLAGCNDCHTPMYGEKGGNVPEKDWLIGSPVGFKGPWGTTYPSNLRLMVKTFKEKPFINYVRTKKYRPPMPGYVFQAMTDKELSAMYAFISSLGAAGSSAPSYVPPTEKPKTPFIYFMPVTN